MAALGTIYAVLDEPKLRRSYQGVEKVEEYLTRKSPSRRMNSSSSPTTRNIIYDVRRPASRVRGYLGVDVGSISTNLVVIDEEGNVLAKRYLMTAGRPLEAVKRGLAEIGDEVGELVDVVGVGTTGSAVTSRRTS
jgi:activator of 2-hydroxyglutaryl-CoA dehydratase